MLASPKDVQQRRDSAPRKLNPVPSKFSLTIRILAEREGDQWQAFTLEFGLAAQADSLQEVKQKLESMIRSYLLDAVGEDREHALELLSRKATWQVYAKYYFCWAICHVSRMLGRSKDHVIYNQPVPLVPSLS